MSIKNKKIIKTVVSVLSVAFGTALFGFNAFSVIDFSAGESGLINNESTPYSVNITAEGQTVAIVPVGIGVRGDADEDGSISLYDAIKISKYLVGKEEDGFEGSLGFMMADSNLSGRIELYDAINVAKYLIISGTHEEKWSAILGN